MVISQSLIRDGRIDANSRLLYGILASFRSGGQDLPFPSLDTLSHILGKTRKTTQRCLKELEQWGLIVRHRLMGKGWTSTRYELKPHIPDGFHSRKEKRKRAASNMGKKRPTSKNHVPPDIPVSPQVQNGPMVRTTSLPESPSAIGQMKHDSRYHSHSCMCIDCRAVKVDIVT